MLMDIEIDVRSSRSRDSLLLRRSSVNDSRGIDAEVNLFLEEKELSAALQQAPENETRWLRIGVFHDADKTALVSLSLSKGTMELAASLGLSLEASFYPCSG